MTTATDAPVWCSNCDDNPATLNGTRTGQPLCRPCYAYQWRTGRPRPSRLIARNADLHNRRLQRQSLTATTHL